MKVTLTQTAKKNNNKAFPIVVVLSNLQKTMVRTRQRLFLLHLYACSLQAQFLEKRYSLERGSHS
jgi:hypothetical protein